MTKNSIISDIVTKDYQTSIVFKSYGIDFCCNGNRSIVDACNESEINLEPLINDLQSSLLKETLDNIDYNTYSITSLISHIVEKHHSYLKRTAPTLTEFLAKVSKVHGPTEPHLIQMFEIYSTIIDDLMPHLIEEENDFFPLLIQYEKNKTANLEKLVSEKIDELLLDHLKLGKNIFKLRDLSDNYSLPDHACNTYKATFKLLIEMESDLFKHIHLENNILIKKVI